MTIQIIVIDQYLPVVLFLVMLYKVVETQLMCLSMKFLCGHLSERC